MFTCVFFGGKLGFPFLTWLYFLYSYSLRLEQEHFSRRTADYIYACLIIWVVLLGIGYVFDLMVKIRVLHARSAYFLCPLVSSLFLGCPHYVSFRYLSRSLFPFSHFGEKVSKTLRTADREKPHALADYQTGCLQLINVPMILAVVYIWSSANQELIVNFWFGITFQVRGPVLHACEFSPAAHPCALGLRRPCTFRGCFWRLEFLRGRGKQDVPIHSCTLSGRTPQPFAFISFEASGMRVRVTRLCSSLGRGGTSFVWLLVSSRQGQCALTRISCASRPHCCLTSPIVLAATGCQSSWGSLPATATSS